MAGSKFTIGDCVEKVAGYKYPGIVVSVFKKTTGECRYVVECTAKDVCGILHIFNERQLKKAA